MGRIFGTDGARGIANKELTVDLALSIGRAAAVVLTNEDVKHPTFVIGKDTRVSGDMLEGALVAGLTSVGANVIILGVVPTPAVAYLVKKFNADAGIMISASHNPFEFNGIKLFNEEGFKLPDEIEEKIEDNPQYYLDDCLKDFDEDTEHTYMAEMPKVHIRDGDAREIYETVLPPDAIKNKKIYRSVHYIVKYHGVYIEIQVRTLFEEGWGEIDHHIVYPYYQDDMLFQQYTSLLNRLTGLADEMSSFFCEVKRLEEEHLQRVKTEPDGNESQKIVDEEDEISKACPVEEKEPLLDDNTAAACIQNVLYE